MRVVDLFSGAGGLTFGFTHRIRANKFVNHTTCEVIFANEFDSAASSAFRLNFPKITLLEEDISNIDSSYLSENNIDYSNIDAVIGGPPCQSFSTVGKRQYDNRAKMYMEYIRILNLVRPKVFVFENVVGLLSMKNSLGLPVIDDIKTMFNAINKNGFGYQIEQHILDAVDYGVPQNRKRVFLVGVRNDFNSKWKPPSIGNSIEQITVSDAISDLPFVDGATPVEQYSKEPITSYQMLMRNNSTKINDHFSGEYGLKIKTVIQNLSEGESKSDFNSRVEQGKISEEFFLTSGYNNTYGRLWWDKPSTTITNSLGTPSALRCIHPKQDRALTTREGARLQSLPDTFQFTGNKAQRNSQVGNAVPPLLAIEVAKSLENLIEEIDNE